MQILNWTSNKTTIVVFMIYTGHRSNLNQKLQNLNSSMKTSFTDRENYLSLNKSEIKGLHLFSCKNCVNQTIVAKQNILWFSFLSFNNTLFYVIFYGFPWFENISETFGMVFLCKPVLNHTLSSPNKLRGEAMQMDNRCAFN